jgi:hypothetical protein
VQATVTPPPIRRPRRWRWKTWLLAALVLVGVPLGYLKYRTWAGERDLREALAETDRLDPGWRLQDLRARRRPIPDDRSAAKQVLKVLATAKGDVENSLALSHINAIAYGTKNGPLTGPQVAALSDFFADEAAARAEAFKLKDLSEGWSDTDQDPNGLRFQGTREVRLWLLLDAALRAQEDDGDGALAACRGMLNVVRSYGVEPGGQGLVWCKQFHPTSVFAVERVVGLTQPTEEALAQMQAALERETTLDLREALRERRAEGWRRIEQLLADQTTFFQVNAKSPLSRGWLARYVPLATPSDAAEYLRGMNRLLELIPPPLDGRFDEWMRLMKDWHATDPLFVDCVQAAEQAIWEHYWSQSHLRMAIAGVAAERYRRKFGGWPDALEDLVAAGFLHEVPVDPFDGQPLRWDRFADAVAVRTARYGSFRLWDPAARRRPAELGP